MTKRKASACGDFDPIGIQFQVFVDYENGPNALYPLRFQQPHMLTSRHTCLLRGECLIKTTELFRLVESNHLAIGSL